jgi:ubiquinone/menaquinone biosynthesis C-methylase UbiE
VARSVEEAVKYLMSDERCQSQNPQTILDSFGVKKGAVIADLGCGPGFYTIPLAEATGETGIVYAVDSNLKMLNYLQENIKKSGVNSNIIKIVNGNVVSTGIAEKTVDVAFFANLLHDVENRFAFLEELKRICKPTALLVDVDWKKLQAERGPPFNIRLSEEEATQLLSENGFAVIKQVDLGPTHYVLVCRITVK